MQASAAERIQALADPAITRISYLIEHGENEAVQLAAAKDALDRAGYKPVEKRESKNTTDLSLREVTDDALKQMLKAAEE